MNKKIIFGFLSVLILVSGLLVFTGCQEEEKEEVIKIGAILPLSNSVLVSRGEDTKKSLEMAINEINSQGGINGKEVELIVEDNQGKAELSINALNKILLTDDPEIIYSLFTGPTIAMVPIIKENNKLMIYQSTVLSMAREEKAYICDDYWNFEKLGERFAELSAKEDHKKIGLLRSQTEYGESFENSFVKKAKELNLNYTIETFGLEDKNVKTQLTKFKYENVDLIISDGFISNYINLIKGLENLDYIDNITLIGTSTLYDLEKIADENILNNLEKLKVISAYSKKEGKKIETFLEKWEKISEKPPQTEALYAYDDMKIIAEALEHCKDNKEFKNQCLYDYIKSNKFEVLEGEVIVDKECVFDRQLDFLIYEGQNWNEYK